MGFEDGGINKEKAPEISSDEELIGDIEREIAFIDASKDNLNKKIKIDSLKIVGKLKNEIEPEKKKDLILELRTGFGLIDVFHGSNLDKEAKTKATELIEKLYRKNN